MINKIFITLMFTLIILTGLVNSTEQNLGNTKTNYPMSLIQNCENSTYANVTRIVQPNKTILESDLIMTKTGDDYAYIYTPLINGEYQIYGNCDENGIKTSWAYRFNANADGKEYSLIEAIIWIFVFVITYVLLIFKNKIPLYSFIGATIIMINGIVGYFVTSSLIIMVAMFLTIFYWIIKFFQFMERMNIGGW